MLEGLREQTWSVPSPETLARLRPASLHAQPHGNLGRREPYVGRGPHRKCGDSRSDADAPGGGRYSRSRDIMPAPFRVDLLPLPSAVRRGLDCAGGPWLLLLPPAAIFAIQCIQLDQISVV
jgi:hypothetical protein